MTKKSIREHQKDVLNDSTQQTHMWNIYYSPLKLIFACIKSVVLILLWSWYFSYRYNRILVLRMFCSEFCSWLARIALTVCHLPLCKPARPSQHGNS